MRFLIVEDDKIAQVVAKYTVQELGYDFDIASTANEAIEYARTTKYHLILMDIGLDQGHDGFEVATEIRKNSLINLTTPIIAVTAHIDEEYREKAAEVGMLAFINKPLGVNLLKNYIENL